MLQQHVYSPYVPSIRLSLYHVCSASSIRYPAVRDGASAQTYKRKRKARTSPCFSAEPKDAGPLCRSAGRGCLPVHRRDEEDFEPGLPPSLLAHMASQPQVTHTWLSPWATFADPFADKWEKCYDIGYFPGLQLPISLDTALRFNDLCGQASQPEGGIRQHLFLFLLDLEKSSGPCN